jgi:hypothetical protein
MASLRNKPKATSPEAAQESLEAFEPQPELAATAELLRSQIDDLRRAEERHHGEQDAVETGEDRRREWVATNPLAQQHAAELNALHRDALGAGLVDTSSSYFDFMDARLAALAAKTPAATASNIVKDMEERVKNAPQSQRQQEAAPGISPGHFSAPVSRTGPSLSGARRGSVSLSPAQREAAKFSGISEVEYARQLERFEELRDSGALQR